MRGEEKAIRQVESISAWSVMKFDSQIEGLGRENTGFGGNSSSSSMVDGAGDGAGELVFLLVEEETACRFYQDLLWEKKKVLQKIEVLGWGGGRGVLVHLCNMQRQMWSGSF